MGQTEIDYSLDSKLQTLSICSIKVLSILEVFT